MPKLKIATFNINEVRSRIASPLTWLYIKAAPERVVWGGDWPHPTEKVRKPDDAQLLDLVATWAPDAATQRRILVSNPTDSMVFEAADRWIVLNLGINTPPGETRYRVSLTVLPS